MKTSILTKNISFIIITTLLVLVSAFFLCGTVASQSSRNADITEDAYIRLEREFLADIRYKLTTEGYENCGINLTRTVDTDGSRLYEISLHHKYLNNLNDTELSSLYQQLSLSAIPFENCSFTFSLI